MFMGTRGRRVCKVAYPRESKMFFNGASMTIDSADWEV